MNIRSPNQEEVKRKEKVAKLLEADRVRLLLKQPFIGAIIMRLNLVAVCDSGCLTAATDGENIFVHCDFYLSLANPQRLALLAHEVWHIVYCHFVRRGKRERNRFNIATDMEVNRMLAAEKMTLPEGALFPPKEWSELNAEEIYERLPSEQKQPVLSLDCHVEPGDDVNPPDQGSANTKWVRDLDYEPGFADNPAERCRELVLGAATQLARSWGKLPDSLEKLIERYRQPQLNWRELLAQFVTSCYGGNRRWLPPSRRYIAQGLYLQSRRSQKLNAVVAIDTSGSTTDDLPDFVAELNGVLNSFGDYELTVIQCDDQLHSVETYTQDRPLEVSQIKMKGFGGTDFRPVFQYLEKDLPETQLLIFFTDGAGPAPNLAPRYPVLWCLPLDCVSPPVSWGSVLHLKLASDHDLSVNAEDVLLQQAFPGKRGALSLDCVSGNQHRGLRLPGAGGSSNRR